MTTNEYTDPETGTPLGGQPGWHLDVGATDADPYYTESDPLKPEATTVGHNYPKPRNARLEDSPDVRWGERWWGIGAVFCAKDKDQGAWYGYAIYWAEIRDGDHAAVHVKTIMSGRPPAPFFVAMQSGIDWMNQRNRRRFVLPQPSRH